MTVEEARAIFVFFADLVARWSRNCRPNYCRTCLGLYRELDAVSLALDNATAAAHQHVRAPAWLERIAW